MGKHRDLVFWLKGYLENNINNEGVEKFLVNLTKEQTLRIYEKVIITIGEEVLTDPILTKDSNTTILLNETKKSIKDIKDIDLTHP